MAVNYNKQIYQLKTYALMLGLSSFVSLRIVLLLPHSDHCSCALKQDAYLEKFPRCR